jgi:hypothetical protein
MPDAVKGGPDGYLRPRESEAPNVELLLARAQKLRTQRAQVDALQQEIADYVIPRKAVITEKPMEGQERGELVWDSTAIRANELLAARIQGALTSPSIRWFSLKTRDENTNRMYSVRTWLNQVEDALYLALRQSNFNAEIGEMYIDLGAFGIGGMLIESIQRGASWGFMFHAMAPGTYAIAEDKDGQVDTVYRFLSMSVRQAAQQFGRDALPDDWGELLERNPDAERSVIHVIQPRTVENPERLDARHWPWMSVYLAEKEKHILEEGGYREFPCVVPRWSKTTGEIYGRGPGLTALADIRTMNRAIELTLSAAAKALDPPGLVASDAAIAELDLRPGSQNTVEGDPRMAWTPLESGAKFDVSKLLTEDWRNSIRNTFYWDNLQLQTERVMTATEVQRRLELMQQFLAPTLARLESEALDPLLHRVFALMMRQRRLPPPPQELSGAELDIEYEGPLARSQKATRLAGFDEYIRLMTPVVQLQPQVFDNINFDAVARDLAEVAGLPASYLRAEDDVQGMRQERAQQQQIQQQLQVAAGAAKAGGDLAPLIEATKPEPGVDGGAGQDMMAELMGRVMGGNGGRS